MTDGPPRVAARARVRPVRAVLVVLLAGLVPWSVQTFPGSGSPPFLRFAWAGVSLDPVPVVRLLPTYVGLSGSPLLGRWLLSSTCWLCALASAALGWIDREDARVTAGLLVLAGAVNASVALSFGVQPSRSGYPVGSLVLWAVAAWRYRRALPGR